MDLLELTCSRSHPTQNKPLRHSLTFCSPVKNLPRPQTNIFSLCCSFTRPIFSLPLHGSSTVNAIINYFSPTFSHSSFWVLCLFDFIAWFLIWVSLKMGKNQAYKAMQRARLGSSSAGPDEVEDGMVCTLPYYHSLLNFSLLNFILFFVCHSSLLICVIYQVLEFHACD
jgi:hypothetical protein